LQDQEVTYVDVVAGNCDCVRNADWAIRGVAGGLSRRRAMTGGVHVDINLFFDFVAEGVEDSVGGTM